MIDIDKLVEESDIVNVLDFFGEEIIEKSGRIYIRCPEHMKRLGKEDFTIGNCLVKDNRYYCFSCKASGNALNYIQSRDHYSFKDSTTLLAKINGFTIDRYKIDEQENNPNHSGGDPFPLTSLDIQLLNIQKSVIEDISENILYRKEECDDDRKVLPRIHYFSFYRGENNDKNHEIVYETGYTLKKSLIQLYESDKESFSFLIKGKIKEAQADIVACIDSKIIPKFFKNKHFELKAERELKKNLKELNKLAVKFELPEVNAHM